MADHRLILAEIPDMDDYLPVSLLFDEPSP